METTDAKVLRVLAITRKPHSASWEQRILNYVQPLREFNIKVDCLTFPKSTFDQMKTLRETGKYDVVWWHRHLLTRWRLRQLRRYARRIIYDFDDPLFFSTRTSGKSLVRQWRFSGMLRASDAALAGSHYLHDLARPHCRRTYVLPMAVTLDAQAEAKTHRDKAVELLWLGSRSTQKYLEMIRPALEIIGTLREDVQLRLLAHEPMAFGKLKVSFTHWNPVEQDLALAEADIGLCPMPDNPWTKGKCPYKVLQYMASQMPWVGSGVGENIVTAGKFNPQTARGICAQNTDEWVEKILLLIEDRKLRNSLGTNGRRYIEQHHGRHILVKNLVDILFSVAGGD